METYICPNDRQLALRARLGTGWSSRSQSAQGRTPTRLSTEEEEQILHVLQRNEQLAEGERHRIDQMLRRLDRMKQDSTPQNRNECALCKQEFGRLTNLPRICADCGRSVCSVCSVEMPVRIHDRQSQFGPRRTWVPITASTTSLNLTPNRELGQPSSVRIRHTSEQMTEDNGGSPRSAAFRVYLPSAGRPNSAGFLSAGQHWIDQLRLRRRSRQDNSQATVCKICREAREIWKRSGAWFYKTLPRSQMASCPSSPTGSTRTPGNATSPTDLVGPSHTLSETDNNEWVQVQPRNVIGSPSKTDGFVPNLACETSSSKAMNTPPQHLDVTTGKESIFGMLNANGTAGKVHPYPEKQRKVIGSESPRSVPMNPCADLSCRPPMATSPTLVPSLPFHPAFSNTRPQGTSTASALAQSFGLLNASKKVASLTGESTLPSGPTASPSVPSRRCSRVASDDAPFGILYFTLYHDTINKQLHVAIHKAKNLIAMDANGLSDPYVVCQILPSSHNSARPRTSTRPQCLNPVWNEALTFEPFEEKNMHQKTLRLAVLDEDLYGSDWLGEYWLSLSRLTSDRLTDFAVPLGPRKPLHRGEFDLACPTRGKIQLGLRYLEEKRQLCVEVIRCSDLAPMDQNGLSDPFVKLYLRPDKAKKTKQKTQVKKATLFPEFHEQFCYEMSPSEAGNRTLEVTVWDFDRGPSNDFIGGLTLGAGAKAERRELWLAVFRPPFRRIEAWFQLSSRNDPGDQSSTPGVCD